MTVDRVAVVYGISRTSAYEGIRSGEIPSIRVGKRIIVPTALVRQSLGLDQPAA